MLDSTMHSIMHMPGTMGALVIALACTGALVALRVLWGFGLRPSARVNPHLTGRRAAVYRYTPDGLQNERGITERARLRAEAAALATPTEPPHA